MTYTDQCFRLDISSIGNLRNGKYEFKFTKLKGTILIKKDDYIDIDSLNIRIETQKTNYGVKSFFICPYCFNNRQHLYHTNNTWMCRECGNIKYRSTTTYRNGMGYCDLKIDNILRMLKAEYKIEYYTGDLIPYKPKRMRYETYNDLIAKLRHWQIERAERWLRLVYAYLSK